MWIQQNTPLIAGLLQHSKWNPCPGTAHICCLQCSHFPGSCVFQPTVPSQRGQLGQDKGMHMLAPASAMIISSLFFLCKKLLLAGLNLPQILSWLPQGLYLKAWKTLICITEYAVEQSLFPAWNLCFPSYLRKKRTSGKSRKIIMTEILEGKVNITPDCDWYIVYHSINLKLMNSQVPSSLKCVAQFPRADRKWTEREECWKVPQKSMCTSPGEHEVPHPQREKLSSCLIMSHSGLAGGFLESKKATFLVLFVHKSSHYAKFWQQHLYPISLIFLSPCYFHYYPFFGCFTFPHPPK